MYGLTVPNFAFWNMEKRMLACVLVCVWTTAPGQAVQHPNPADFVPNGFVVFEKITGDLDKDHDDDCLLVIKGTDKNKIVTTDFQTKADRNRRGIIVLLNKGGHYELAIKNYACFSSENEDGGIYFPPELNIQIKNGNLVVHYGHGRYGYWSYTFRLQHEDFELIGYDESDDHGPVVNSTTSINFLTKTKITRKNIREDAAPGGEVFKTTTEKIKINKLIRLSEIHDFDELDMSGF